MRTIEEIYDEIIAEKETFSSLDGLMPSDAANNARDTATNLLAQLSSQSKVAIWRLLAYVTAVAIYFHEGIWQVFKQEVEEKARQAIAGTPAWYAQMAKKFQYGSQLVLNNFTPTYPIVLANQQIIKRVAIVDGGGAVFVKVATESNGTAQALQSAELEAFTTYMNQIKFAGTKLNVSSLNADQIRITTDIYYNPEFNATATTSACISAVNKYLVDLPFNGQIDLQKLTDALQSADGVRTLILRDVTIVEGDQLVTLLKLETGINIPFYIGKAGYFTFDNTNSVINLITVY